jgi:hypothetical protein
LKPVLYFSFLFRNQFRRLSAIAPGRRNLFYSRLIQQGFIIHQTIKHFTMTRKLQLLSALIMLVIAGCQKDVQLSPTANRVPSTLAGAQASTIYLSVTVQDLSTNNIISDGKGAYIHGTDRVEATILSSDGNFYMNTNNNTVKAPIRNMLFLPNNPELALNGERNYSLRTAAGTWLQNMVVGSSQNVGFRAWGVQQGGVVDWRLLFRNGWENSTTSLTDYAKVTRSSNDVWIIEPANYAGVTPAYARLITGSDPPLAIGAGYYQVPFKLTLTRLVK